MKYGKFRVIEARLDDLNAELGNVSPMAAYFMGVVSALLEEVPTKEILAAAAKCRDTKDLLLLMTTLENLNK